MYNTDLYFEAHVTLAPETIYERQTFFNEICKSYGFKPAELYMQDRVTKSQLDMFCTARSKVFENLYDDLFDFLECLKKYDFEVYRYKIENTLLDVRLNVK